MRIEQDVPQFTPITITLETREEAEALWFAIRGAANLAAPMGHLAFWISLSDWFSNESRL